MMMMMMELWPQYCNNLMYNSIWPSRVRLRAEHRLLYYWLIKTAWVLLLLLAKRGSTYILGGARSLRDLVN